MSTSNNFTVSLNEKEFICDVCHKIFKRIKDLKSHFIVHVDVKPHCCTICPEAFKHKISLKRHLLIHSGEKPYICQLCGKSFRQKGSLNEHCLTHTGEKPHTCEVCSLGFTTKSNYVRHLRKHMPSKSFICSLCGKGFNVRSYLTQHYEKAHKETNAISASQCDESLNSSAYKLDVDKTTPDVFVASSSIIGKSSIKELQKQNNVPESCNLSHTSNNHSGKLHIKSFSKDVQKHLKIRIEKNVNKSIYNKELAVESKQNLNKNIFKNIYDCSVCKRSYKKEIDFIQHSLIHKIPGPFECDICVNKMRFENLYELHKHYTEHGDNICLCFFCSDSCEKNSDCINLRTYSHSLLYKCNACHMSFSESIFLKKHSSHHKKHGPLVIKLKI